ncbi:MAG: LPS export ABC transporter periplasmic protein LptC [Comamonadaceae bacterium]|jgi:lipopolysaccharide export system protein LptC|nr:LPS export ABC transporter periplasmic protein LptC [Comamonadaceae bacterium]
MSSALRRSWDRLSLYLPVLLMGLLAMGTWWLVRSAPRPPAADAQTVLRHAPDYSLRDFAVKNFGPDGQLQSELQGRVGHHYPDTDTLEIEQVQMRSISPEGRVTTAHARRGLSNADGSEVQLFGDAVVTRAAQQLPDGRVLPRLQFEGEFLHAWTQDERVRSHLPVTLLRGTDRFTADRMDYDNMAQQMQLQGRVHGVLQPATPARP